MSFYTPFPNRRWLIIPSNIVDQINYDQVLEYYSGSLRYSVDGTKTFVKYDITDPNTGETFTIVTKAGTYGRPTIYDPSYPEYNHEDILNVLETPEWRTPDPNIDQLNSKF
jgi:hypothetical protein